MIEDMRIHMKAYGCAILLMLLFFGVVGMNTLSEGNYGEGTRSITQPQRMIYINGDWDITTDTVRSNETIVLSGNLTVYSGATLTFKNVTLIVNSSSTRDYRIEVKRGATMIITDWDNDNTTTADGSNITAVDANYGLLFWVRDGSNFSMKNSELHKCGGWALQAYDPVALTYGLYIETDNATIDHNLISYNNDGIVLYGSDATISNNTITWNGDTGIFSGYWSNGTIENNWITWNDGYGIWVTGGDNTHPKPSNPKIINNVITDTGRGKDTAVGIQIEYSCKPFIKDTQILRSTEDGVYSADSSTPTLINVTIDAENKGNYGLVGSSTGYLYVINSTIKNSKIYDLSSNSNSYFVVINTSFDKSECDGTGANITVKWYLHVYVEDSLGTPIPSANVRIKDNENGTYDENFTTDANGYVKWIELTEYVDQNVSGHTNRTYYTPYNITVNYSGLNFSNNPRNSTINESKTEVFTATGPLPEFDSVVIPVLIAVLIGVSFLRRKRKPRR